MTTILENFYKTQTKKDLPDIRPGDTVRVHQKIKETQKKEKGGEEEKERIQIFEGVIIARKHGKETGSTITVRKVVSGVGVEKIFPLRSPIIEKIEILTRGRARRAKLYYLRKAKGRKSRLKQKKFVEALPAQEESVEERIESAEELS